MKLFTFLFLCLFTFAAQADEVYERVMESGKIRCGYFIWPPYLDKDVNTGEMSGLYYDLTEKIGEKLSLDIEWVEEVSFDAMFVGYRADRYDMVCAPVFPMPSRARASDFTMPVAYIPQFMYARHGDARFDNNFERANQSDIKFAFIDGEASQLIQAERFSKAQAYSSLSIADGNQILNDISTRKADVTVLEASKPSAFIRNNPDSLKRVDGGPVQVSAVSFSIPRDDPEFRRMLDITIANLHDLGLIETIFDSYLRRGTDFLPVVRPYRYE